MNSRFFLLVPFFLAGLSFTAQSAAQEAGTVNFVSGDVSAERQPPVPLSRGDSVLENDAIVTGDASRAQLLMIDGAKLAVRPNSRIVIEEYSYEPETAASSTVISSSDDTSVTRLVKGGFRTITGAIGNDDPTNVEVRTPVGVLGIRGTDFTLLLCRGDCSTAPGVPAGATVADGLYIMVTDGRIVFRNEAANIELGPGEFAFIPFDTRRAEKLDVAPPVFIDTSDFQFVGDGSADSANRSQQPSGFDAKLGSRRVPESSSPASSTTAAPPQDSDVPEQSIIGVDQDGSSFDLTPGVNPPPPPSQPQNRSIGFVTNPLGQFPAFGSTAINAETDYTFDASDGLTRFANQYPGRAANEPADFELGTSANVETGSDAQTVLRWGRWSGGTAAITLTGGADASQPLTNQSLHWIASPGYATAPILPISGTATYSLVGATSPTDGIGNTGTLGDATFQANFTNMTVTSTLDLTINGNNWVASGDGLIGAQADPALPAHLFSGFYNSVSINGINGGLGNFAGFFSDPGPASDPSFPGGVGLTYSLENPQTGESASGAAAFGNP